jgi:hypothetical protein
MGLLLSIICDVATCKMIFEVRKITRELSRLAESNVGVLQSPREDMDGVVIVEVEVEFSSWSGSIKSSRSARHRGSGEGEREFEGLVKFEWCERWYGTGSKSNGSSML